MRTAIAPAYAGPVTLNAVLRRTAAEPRLINGAAVALGLALTVLAVKTPWSPLPRPVVAAAGVAASSAVWFRGRWPVPVALVAAAGYAASGNPGPLLVGLFSGAASTSARRLAMLAGVGVAGLLAPDWPGHGGPAASQIAFAATGTLGVMASGGYVARRRELTDALRERAELAEAARRLQDDRARVAERTRIAREMHDVLGHKVALICLHAGGLEVNAGAGAARVEQGAALIRATAQETLAEMRAILGCSATGTTARRSSRPTRSSRT